MGYKFYKDSTDTRRQYEELLGKTSDYDQLRDDLAKLKTQYASQKELQERLAKEWSAEEKFLRDKIKALADASFEGNTDPTEGTVDVLAGNKLYGEVAFGDGPTIGAVKIYDLLIEEGNIKSITSESWPLKHEIQIKAAITKNEETGEVSILTKAFWTQLEESRWDDSKWKDKPYPLNITGGSIIIDPTEPIDPRLKNRFMFAPHINFGVFGAGTARGLAYGTHFDVTLWGYGKTENDLDFLLGGIGMNIGNPYHYELQLVPAQYRIANHLPLLSNVYIGAGIGYSSNGTSASLMLTGTL